MKSSISTWKGLSKIGPGGIRVVFTTKDADTPCMVYLKNDSATFDCANDTGEIGEHFTTPEQQDWLRALEPQADACYEAARAGHPDYS